MWHLPEKDLETATKCRSTWKWNKKRGGGALSSTYWWVCRPFFGFQFINLYDYFTFSGLPLWFLCVHIHLMLSSFLRLTLSILLITFNYLFFPPFNPVSKDSGWKFLFFFFFLFFFKSINIPQQSPALSQAGVTAFSPIQPFILIK